MMAVILGILFYPALCHAQTTFNWPTTPAWTAGSPDDGASQTVDYTSTGQPISVTVTNMTGNAPGGTWNSGYPQVESNGSGGNNGVNGGTGIGVNGLLLQPGAEATTSGYIQVTVNFNYSLGVKNVSFQFWDIDATVDGSGNGFIDTIKNLQATAVGGGTVYPTSVSSEVAGYNIISGSGATLTIAGDPSQPSGASNSTNQGTINVSFSQAVSSISFQYSNGATGSRTTQTMGVGPISFDIVPEVNSASAALMLCGGVMGFGLLRRRSRGAERSHCPPRI